MRKKSKFNAREKQIVRKKIPIHQQARKKQRELTKKMTYAFRHFKTKSWTR